MPGHGPGAPERAAATGQRESQPGGDGRDQGRTAARAVDVGVGLWRGSDPPTVPSDSGIIVRPTGPQAVLPRCDARTGWGDLPECQRRGDHVVVRGKHAADLVAAGRQVGDDRPAAYLQAVAGEDPVDAVARLVAGVLVGVAA